MKKIFSLILSAALLLNASSTAMAAENEMADTLISVTEKVKSQITISNDFTKFNGYLENNVYNEYWNLRWEKDGESSLSIDATPTGKIMSYHLFKNNEVNFRNADFVPTFPKLSRDNAKEIANKFLKRVVNTSNEGFVFFDNEAYYRPADTTSYDFYGCITFNSTQSPINFNVRVDTQSQSVTYFARTDLHMKYIGSVPSSKPSVSKTDAEKLLNSMVKLRLEYITENSVNSKDVKNSSKKAVLRYIPEYSGNYIVDAQTGKLIDLDTAFKEAEKEDAGSAKTENRASMQADDSLTKTETDGIDKIKGVLTKDKLDSAVRAYSEFGLNGFTLNDVHYYMNDENNYHCNLNYLKADSKDKVTYKYITVNAKTAELISVYTNYPYDSDNKNKNAKFTKSETQKKAEDFLSKHFNDKFTKTKLYRANESIYEDYGYQFAFAQQVNGYFYPENLFDVSINNETGTIDSFSVNFDDKVVFDSADNLVSAEKALDSYNKGFTTKLSYIDFPKKLDLSEPEYELLIKRGLSYVYELKLAYAKNAEPLPYGVDAKTGKLLVSENPQASTITYTDIKSDKEILALADYGVGFTGGKFEKNKQLTQKDMLILLISANGTVYNADQVEEIYQTAYSLGILKKVDRNENKKITRTELVKTIIEMSGYGKAASLSGIYICNFKDSKDIPKNYYGYVAIAQGLGLIKSGANVTFAPNTVATREQAAIILYNFMNR